MSPQTTCVTRSMKCWPASRSARPAPRRLVAQLSVCHSSDSKQKMFRTFTSVGAGLTLLIVVVFAAFAQISAGTVSTTKRPGLQVVKGVDITDVRQIDLDGLKKLLERDPKDARPLLVNFWATWCDGCREEFPDLVKI